MEPLNDPVQKRRALVVRLLLRTGTYQLAFGVITTALVYWSVHEVFWIGVAAIPVGCSLLWIGRYRRTKGA
jgi:hypothetical protein